MAEMEHARMKVFATVFLTKEKEKPPCPPQRRRRHTIHLLDPGFHGGPVPPNLTLPLVCMGVHFPEEGPPADLPKSL